MAYQRNPALSNQVEKNNQQNFLPASGAAALSRSLLPSALTALLTVSAFAGAATMHADSLIDRYDTDNDGSLALQEFQSALQTIRERSRQDPGSAQQLLRKWDSDRNDKLNAEELQQGLDRWTGKAHEGGSYMSDLKQLEGKTLYNEQGEELGEIDRIMSHKRSGQPFAIVSTRGFIGIGGEESALAVRRLREKDGKIIASNVQSKSDLLEQPYEEMNFEKYTEKKKSSLSKTDSDTSLQQLVSSNPEELAGLKVVDSQQREIGEAGYVVLERGKGGCEFFLVFSSDETLGIGDEDAVVSIKDVVRQDDKLMLQSLDKARLFIKEEYLKVEEVD